MNRNQLRALRSVLDDTRTAVPITETARSLGLSLRTVHRVVNVLVKKGIVSLSQGAVSLSLTPKASALARVSRRFDISRLLLDSGEVLLPSLMEPRTQEELEKLTELSTPTIYRTLNRMMETGAITKRDERYFIDKKLEDLYFLAKLIREEGLAESIPESKAEEVVFHRGRDIIKRVAGGKKTTGSPTAFSVFPSFGMQLGTEADYYIMPERSISAEDTLIHALAVSHNKLQRTHCAVFYVLNREILDPAKMRNVGDEFGVGHLWLSLEKYVRGLTVPGDLFLPWDEFAERCSLYGKDARALLPHPAYPDLFEGLGEALRRPLEVYLIGGENMRIRRIKQATKDVDLVVKSRSDYGKLSAALDNVGYRTIARSQMSPADLKLEPSGIFVKEGMPRIDIFTRIICNKLHLVESMISDAETQEFGSLKLRLLSNEDVFLLKSVTDREADDVDMIEILRASRSFDWKHLLQTLYEEERVSSRHFCFDLFQSVDFIQTVTNIRIPVYRKLLNHTTDQAILQALRNRGWMGIKEMVGMIGEIRETEVRNRIRVLIGEGKVKKKRSGGRALFALRA